MTHSRNAQIRLGYCCINTSLKQLGITTNRGMTRKTFDTHGIHRASHLAIQNLEDLLRVLQYNADHSISVFRMSSDLFPWMSEYRFDSLPNFATILDLCQQVGQLAFSTGQRLSFHPGQFNVLASPRADLVRRTAWELDQHSRIMDMMGLPVDHSSAINIHIGGAYGDKVSAARRFIDNFQYLEESTRRRLVIENDDSANGYTVRDLHDLVYAHIGTPITFDHFHHDLNPGDMSRRDAAHLAATTWSAQSSQVIPLQHYSSSKRLHEDPTARRTAHADYIYEPIPNHGIAVDIELEAKAKEGAIYRYLETIHIGIIENLSKSS